MQQHPAWRIDAKPGEQLRIAQRQFDHLAKLVDRFLQPADIVIGDVGPAMLRGFLIFRPQFDLRAFVDMDNALGQRRHDTEAYLRERKGRRGQHLPQLRRHVASVHLLLAVGCDKVPGIERTPHEAALEATAIALQSEILLGRSEHDFLCWFRFDLANLDKVSRPDTGIGPLQAVESDKIQPLVFGIGQHRPGGGAPLAENFDDIALDQSQFAKIVPRQPGQAATAVLGPRIGDLQFQLAVVFGFVFCWYWIRHGGVSPQYRSGRFQQDSDGSTDIRPRFSIPAALPAIWAKKRPVPENWPEKFLGEDA